MSSADLVTCFCKACQNLLCVSTNQWTEVTSSYATYDVVNFFSHPGLEQTGQTRPGSRDSELEGCTVQPVNCMKCKDSIGVKCIAVAPEKETQRDRCFLKLGKLNIKDLLGNPIEANIKSKDGHQLDPKISAHSKRQNREQHRALQDTDGRNGTDGPFVPTDIENGDLQSQSNVLQMVQRQERDTLVILQNLEAFQEQIASFQDDLRAMKTDNDEIKARQGGGLGQEQNEDIEMLTQTVSQVSSKLGEVEALKLEIKMLQSRIKRLEDEKRAPQKIMGPPLTPRSGPNGSKADPSFDSALNKRPSNNNPKLPFDDHGPGFENHIDRSRAVSVQLDHPHTPFVPSGLRNSRAASVLGDFPRPTPTRSEMPPPPIPDRAATQVTSTRRSSSETPRNPQTQSNLHNAISALNESAIEFPTVVSDSDDEYSEPDRGLDSEENSHQHPRSRQSLPNPITSDDIDPALTLDNPQKRRRTTASHTISRDTVSPPPDDPSYQSVWASPYIERQANSQPNTPQRNEAGLLIKNNGQIDKRSLRFLGRANERRKQARLSAVRDEAGYLLKPDGTRNKRSVSIINAMRHKDDDPDLPQ